MNPFRKPPISPVVLEGIKRALEPPPPRIAPAPITATPREDAVPCEACDGSGRIRTSEDADGSRCETCLGTGIVCTTATESDPASPIMRPPGYTEPVDPVKAARASGLATAKRLAILEVETGHDNGTGHTLDPAPTDTYEKLLPNAKNANELAGPIAMLGLRRLEKGMHDYDPKVQLEAARVAVTVAGRVAEIPNTPGSELVDPAAKRAALVAALGTPQVIALVVEAACNLSGPLALALMRAGWRPEP